MKIVVDYLHCDKGNCRDKGDELGLTDDQVGKLISALYEVKFEIDVDSGEIITVNDRKLV